MPASFELESSIHNDDDDEEEMASLMNETVDGQSAKRSPSQRPDQHDNLSGKKKWVGMVCIFGLILLIVAYPRGSERIDGSVDTLNKPKGSGNYAPAPTPAAAFERPGTGPFGAPGWKMSPSRLSPTYLPRGQPITPAQKQAMTDQYGQWTFVDPKATQRPGEDFYAKFPNRDVPREQFPSNAWQTDSEYLSEFLNASLELVIRAQEAILSEYGHGKLDEPELDFDERSKMFYVNMVDMRNDTWASDVTEPTAAGWHDRTAWENLQKRILHAILTEDSFTFLMGGHSAAAGHGNHFWQSYTLQMGKIIEPVFARMGVFFF
ncbi:hypothetical protein MPSEU_000321500 [Mayamaea pseudoterrestris]|nr:hypothetical protein MPSEU_000321500 [Mayamaea pseudoterrestris]